METIFTKTGRLILATLFLSGWPVFTKAQVQVEPAGNAGGNIYLLTGAFLKERVTACMVDVENKTDVRFSVLNDDLSVKKTFTITGGAWNNEIILAAMEPETDYVFLGPDLAAQSPLLSQTFFNEDEKFEVIRPVFERTGMVQRIVKVEIVSEDGSILGEIPVDVLCGEANPYIRTFSLGNTNYIFSHYRDGDGESYRFYRVISGDAGTVSFSRVKNMSVYPNPVRRDEVLTINLQEAELTDDSYFEMTDTRGVRVMKKPVEPGMREISVPLHRLSRGQYIYTLVSGSRIAASGKVLIK